MSQLVLPRYADRWVGNLLTSVAAQLGLPGLADVVGLPEAERYLVLLVDGLGTELVQAHAELAPYLAVRTIGGESLTVGVPSTTSTTLTSLGTGLVPGLHGLAGFRFRLPETEELFSPLLWDTALPPEAVQPEATLFQTLVASGHQVAMVAPARFEGSGLTRCGLRGARFFPTSLNLVAAEQLAAVEQALTSGAELIYAYVRDVDHAGHAYGVDSDQWRAALAAVDAYAAALAERLPAQTALIVTGDHGMVDVPANRRVIIEDVAELTKGIAAIGGEGRLRHLYTDQPEHVVAAWEAYWGERAWVRTRAQAQSEGWFGEIERDYVERFGDVIVAFQEDWAALTRSYSKEFALIGMHASLTSTEMLVPCVIDAR